MEHGNDDPAFSRYKLGVTMGCWGLFVFAASGAIYACTLKKKNIFFLNSDILVCLERWLANRDVHRD
jgi:hypothetical protein